MFSISFSSAKHLYLCNAVLHECTTNGNYNTKPYSTPRVSSMSNYFQNVNPLFFNSLLDMHLKPAVEIVTVS